MTNNAYELTYKVWWKQTPSSLAESTLVVGINEAIRVMEEHGDAYEHGMFTYNPELHEGKS